MSLTRVAWNPRGGHWLDLMRREMDDFVTRLQDPDEAADDSACFSPRTNVAETNDDYEITLDLPGVNADDFKLELHEGRLSISGERTRESEAGDKTFHRVERHYGSFCRTFTLGQDVDQDNVSAEYKNGVLTVRVPKSEKAQPKRIQVKS